MTQDVRAKYGIVRKVYPNGQAFYVFELLDGTPIEAVEKLRIELTRGTHLEEVKQFEEWLNLHIEAVAYEK